MRRSFAVRNASARAAPVLWGRVDKYESWKAEVKWKTRGWGLTFGVENDNECVVRSMMRADIFGNFVTTKE